MPITTVGVGAAVTPTVLKTYIFHYVNRKPRREKPTAHISYDEGLHLIRSFLDYASHHTVEDLQAFTAQWVPSPSWVRTENVTIPSSATSKAAETIIAQLGPEGIKQVGGRQWWQWRQGDNDLKAEWIEMRAHYNEQKKTGARSRRIMLYVHGGAYFFGSVDEHRYQMQRHARKLKARVFAPRYRLAPQFPFPCGLHDCLAAYLYLLSIHDPTEIILAGDSAGGGMVVSILCMLRDRGMPLPAGAILISPWVDLTHSFPSLVGSSEFDYIPEHGFMQKPSLSWPPPTDEETAIIREAAKGRQEPGKSRPRKPTRAFSEQILSNDTGEQSSEPFPSIAEQNMGDGNTETHPQFQLSIELDGKKVVLKEQIQMYTTNRLLTHPLVSPVLQPSLGGLPPLLILTGGGEVLRDEQIYLAHKAANPSKYPLGKAYRSAYDPHDTILNKYKPTPVYLQVWEDLCHVAPTLSFTRPAKFMYRSVAQFGAWALARAQRRGIEIVDDDNISIISSQSDSEDDGDNESSNDSLAKHKLDLNTATGSIGRAGDAIPAFENNMIRQRIDRYGRVYRLAETADLPAMQLTPEEVGVIKPGPVRKWLEARKTWDNKYANTRRKVQKERIRALASGDIKKAELGEHPPPSALAGRRTEKDLALKKQRKSYGLAMWSGWGSKHDEATLKREEVAVELEKAETAVPPVGTSGDAPAAGADGQIEITPASSTPTPATSRQQSKSRNRSTSARRRTTNDGKLPAGRRRTVSVTDAGQTAGMDLPPPPALPNVIASETNQDQPQLHTQSQQTASTSPPMPPPIVTTHPSDNEITASPETALLSAGFIPKFKTASHLRDDSASTQPASDAASVMTGRSGIVSDDASTRAVFAAPGVISPKDPTPTTVGGNRTSTPTLRPGSPLANETRSIVSDLDGPDGNDPDGVPSPTKTSHFRHAGNDTPRSQRSLDRLRSHQQDEDMGRLQPLRSPSSIAVVRMEGVVGLVDGKEDGPEVDGVSIKGDTAAGGNIDGAVVVNGDEDDPETPKASESTRDGILGSQSDNKIANAEMAPGRPKLYDRADTEFQTAMEKL